MVAVEGKPVEPGSALADENERRYRLVRIDFKNGTSEMREEIRRADGSGWVQRGSESTRRGSIMETAARAQLDARLAKQGVVGARRIEHGRGGGGFDDVVVMFSGPEARPRAKVLIREVKDHPDNYVPLEEFSAIRPPGLGNNLKELDAKIADGLRRLEKGDAVPGDLEGMTSQQLTAIRLAIEDNDIQIDLVLGPTTKVAKEHAKGASVIRELRQEIREDRGGKDVLNGPSGSYDPDVERVETGHVNDAVVAEKGNR